MALGGPAAARAAWTLLHEVRESACAVKAVTQHSATASGKGSLSRTKSRAVCTLALSLMLGNFSAWNTIVLSNCAIAIKRISPMRMPGSHGGSARSPEPSNSWQCHRASPGHEHKVPDELADLCSASQHLSVVLHCHNQDCLTFICWRSKTKLCRAGAVVNHAVSNCLLRVWSEYCDFQRRFQRWQAAHQALLAGTVSAVAPEVISTPEKQVNSKSWHLQLNPKYGRQFVPAPAQVDKHD